jgi:thiamine kinase-like enzyme
MWAIDDLKVARIGDRNTESVARREVEISSWLNRNGVRAIEAIEGAVQPTIVNGHPVTWWKLLPTHRYASVRELGGALRAIHGISENIDLHLPQLSPIDDVRERLMDTNSSNTVDVSWVLSRLDELQEGFEEAITGLPQKPIHGDAWQGNFLVPEDGQTVAIDFEAFSFGPTCWDLLPIAVDYTDFSRISEPEYQEFVSAYGFDVTHIPGYRTLAEIQEIRWTSYVIRKAADDPAAEAEAKHRISCLKGDEQRPWAWNAF